MPGIGVYVGWILALGRTLTALIEKLIQTLCVRFNTEVYVL